jgi:DNA-binding MarR family transcriptional regulator
MFNMDNGYLPTFSDEIHPALKEAFGYRLMRAALKYRKSLLTLLDEFGINPPQLAILRVLSESDLLNQAELGKQLGHDKVTVVRIIDGLEELKFIKRISGITDKRERQIQITKAGRAVLARIKKKDAIREKEFLTPLTKAEALNLKKLIMKL